MEYKLIKTWRKTLAIEIKSGEIIVRVPKLTPKCIINTFLKKHTKWINKKQEESKEQKKEKDQNKNTQSQIQKLKDQAKKYIPQRVDKIAKQFEKKYNTVKITSARTRWGSCTSERNLNFSYRLIQAEKEAIDYVIIHELAHLKHMNHSNQFWHHVGEMMPGYKRWDNWFKNEGKKLG